MKMRISFREGILLSFVFALVFSSAYSEDPNRSEPCTGALLSVGNIVCDENALCFQNDGALTCACQETYSGDGWAAGSGCIKGVNEDVPESGRVKKYVGMWSFARSPVVRCKGLWAYMSSMICVRNAVCMQGYREGTYVKCVCQSGSGNGISRRFSSGTGCR